MRKERRVITITCMDMLFVVLTTVYQLCGSIGIDRNCIGNRRDTISRGSSVGRATDYGVRIPAGAGNCSLRHRVQTGSGAHPVSYPVGTGGSFPGGKAAGA
jgi:hypothetical protein